MPIRSLVTSFALFAFIQPVWSAEDARSIMAKEEEARLQRWRGVDSFIKEQSAAGNPMVLFFERIPGNEHLGFRIVPPNEIMARIELIAGITLEQRRQIIEGLAGGLNMIQSRLPAGMIPPEIFQGLGQFLMAGMVDTSSGAASQQAKDKASAQKSFMDRKRFADMAQNLGVVQVNGRRAYHLRADNINETQQTKYGTFTIKSLDYYVDTETYVPLDMKFNIEGAEQGKPPKTMTIERISTDYRQIGTMYEPFKEVMRIGGGQDGKQVAELEKARREMEKLKRKLESMPPQQKAMVMQMMGPQLKTMEKMAAGDGIEVETVVKSIQIGGVDAYVARVLNRGSTGKSVITMREICNNGIDDDGDGLIDKQDKTDCGS